MARPVYSVSLGGADQVCAVLTSVVMFIVPAMSVGTYVLRDVELQLQWAGVLPACRFVYSCSSPLRAAILFQSPQNARSGYLTWSYRGRLVMDAGGELGWQVNPGSAGPTTVTIAASGYALSPT